MVVVVLGAYIGAALMVYLSGADFVVTYAEFGIGALVC